MTDIRQACVEAGGFEPPLPDRFLGWVRNYLRGGRYEVVRCSSDANGFPTTSHDSPVFKVQRIGVGPDPDEGPAFGDIVVVERIDGMLVIH
jgi:hypothetical protein